MSSQEKRNPKEEEKMNIHVDDLPTGQDNIALVIPPIGVELRSDRTASGERSVSLGQDDRNQRGNIKPAR